MSRHISQREARRLRQRLTTLEVERARFFSVFRREHVGIFLGEVALDSTIHAAIKTARKLQFGVSCQPGALGTVIQFFAIHPETD